MRLAAKLYGLRHWRVGMKTVTALVVLHKKLASLPMKSDSMIEPVLQKQPVATIAWKLYCCRIATLPVHGLATIVLVRAILYGVALNNGPAMMIHLADQHLTLLQRHLLLQVLVILQNLLHLRYLSNPLTDPPLPRPLLLLQTVPCLPTRCSPGSYCW
jgi:hypothetical protein